KIYIDAGDVRAAVPLFVKALEINRHEPECRYQLAAAYQSLGQPKEAAEQRRLLDETQKLLATMSELNREADRKPTDAQVRRRLQARAGNDLAQSRGVVRSGRVRSH